VKSNALIDDSRRLSFALRMNIKAENEIG